MNYNYGEFYRFKVLTRVRKLDSIIGFKHLRCQPNWFFLPWIPVYQLGVGIKCSGMFYFKGTFPISDLSKDTSIYAIYRSISYTVQCCIFTT